MAAKYLVIGTGNKEAEFHFHLSERVFEDARQGKITLIDLDGRSIWENGTWSRIHDAESDGNVVKRYESAEIAVVWRPDKCVHAGECVKGLPNVFLPLERPWVNIGAADSAAIIETVKRCPSGALTVEEKAVLK